VLQQYSVAPRICMGAKEKMECVGDPPSVAVPVCRSRANENVYIRISLKKLRNMTARSRWKFVFFFLSSSVSLVRKTFVCYAPCVVRPVAEM
jgi:hypothetical protein